jgi:hypothetical protein
VENEKHNGYWCGAVFHVAREVKEANGIVRKKKRKK